MTEGISFSVFTKPWKMPIAELAPFVRRLGFAGIELPVRPGYQVEPGNVERDLPTAARQLADHGLKISSVAGPIDEATIETCAELDIPLIRIMAPVGAAGYLAAEARLQDELAGLVPLLERTGVTIGVQNHNGRFVSNASGLRRLIERFDPRHVGIIWDAAHNALNGEDPELALDLVWSHLCLVNLKNAIWRRTNGPEAEVARWEVYWTTGRHGLASWPRVVAELKARHYRGVVCLPAEYTDEPRVDALIAEDVAYARSLFEVGDDHAG